MTPLEYLIRKNIAVTEHIGRTLVPEKQLVNIPLTKRMVEQMEVYLELAERYTPLGQFYPLVDENCPYCAYFASSDNLDCGDCPMSEAGNECSNINSTFETVDNLVKNSKSKKEKLSRDLVALAKEFLESNKEAVNG